MPVRAAANFWLAPFRRSSRNNLRATSDCGNAVTRFAT
jgi:hypothetical protein